MNLRLPVEPWAGSGNCHRWWHALWSLTHTQSVVSVPSRACSKSACMAWAKYCPLYAAVVGGYQSTSVGRTRQSLGEQYLSALCLISGSRVGNRYRCFFRRSNGYNDWTPFVSQFPSSLHALQIVYWCKSKVLLRAPEVAAPTDGCMQGIAMGYFREKTSLIQLVHF